MLLPGRSPWAAGALEPAADRRAGRRKNAVHSCNDVHAASDVVGARLEPWRKSPRARLVGHPRFYLFDPGVLGAVVRRLDAPVDPALRGRLFEHLIVLECMRALDYAKSESALYYWRTNHGAEVDLVVERHGSLRLAIEIEAKRSIDGGDLSGLRSFGEAHPKTSRIVVCLAPEAYSLGDVQIVPYARFLVDIDAWLAGLTGGHPTSP